MTYKWEYLPDHGAWDLVGSDNRRYARIEICAGGCWALAYSAEDKPTKFVNVNEAKDFLFASVVLA